MIEKYLKGLLIGDWEWTRAELVELRGAIPPEMPLFSMPESMEQWQQRIPYRPQELLFLGRTGKSIQIATEGHLAVLGYETKGAPFDSGAESSGFGAESPVVKYLWINTGEIEEEYLERVYRRQKGIPWDILETERCVVRELAMTDLDALYEMYGKENFGEFLEPLFDREKEEEYQKAYIENMYGYYEYGMWLVFHKDTGELMGRAGLELKEVQGESQVELGYVISPEYRGQGYATEVCEAILLYNRNKLFIEDVYCMIERDNTLSIRLAEKLGFVYQDRLTEKGILWERYHWSNH